MCRLVFNGISYKFDGLYCTCKVMDAHLKDGFAGQRLVYVPGKVKKKILADNRVRDLYITHIGHFPGAKGHFRNRFKGSSQYIFIYCRNGKGWIKIDHQKFHLKENEAFVIPPNTPCSYGSSDQDPWDNYWVHFIGENASLYSPPCGEVINLKPSKNTRTEERMELFEEMLQNMENYNNFDHVLYANICLKYFLTTIRHLQSYRVKFNQPVVDYYGKAMAFFKNNLHRRVSLNELSEVCDCSTSHLHKLFMKRLHCAPMECFIQMKIQRACRYLADSNQKVKAIALLMGYDDPYYFSRLFTKYMGKSPVQYRKEEQDDPI